MFIFFLQFWVYINLMVGRRENISLLMKAQRIPLFIHAHVLNARAKCPFHPRGIDRPFERTIQWPLQILRALLRANSHFSRALFFVVAFCMRNSVSFFILVHYGIAIKRDPIISVTVSVQFFLRANTVARTIYSGMICRISFAIDTFFTFEVFHFTFETL